MVSLRCAFQAALAISVLLAASIASSAEITARRAPGASPGASRLVQKPGAGSLRAEDLKQLQLKKERWQSFPDFMTRPSVDWTPLAARRRGFRGPSGKIERSHRLTATGEDASGAVLDTLGPVDTLRVAFIRIDFLTDRGGSKSTGDGKFDLTRPGSAAPPIDRPPRNHDFYDDHLTALSRFYDAQTYGRVKIVGDVWPRQQDLSYHLSDMADLGPWTFGPEIFEAAVHMHRTMFFAADSQSIAMGDRIPWETYDHFVFIHAGGDLQSDVLQDSPEDIPSFTLGVDDSDAVIFPDSAAWNRANPIDRATFVPETINQDGYFGALNGVIAHECGHLLFGFSDLYNTDTGFPVVGLWSLMDSGNLVGSLVVLPDQSEIFATGLLPPSVDPWQRSFTTTPPLPLNEVAYGDTFALRSSERHPDLKRVSLTSDEYLLLENRYQAPADSVELDQADSSRVVLGPKKPDRFEYDALLPGGGVLVWHIDESVIPINEFTFPCDTARANPGCGFNTDPRRLAISVIEADGLNDLGDPNSPFILGSPSDPWPQPLSYALGDSTVPNLLPHIGTHPHIRIDFLSSQDSTMTVAAFRTWQLPGWPRPAPFPPDGPQPLAIDLDGDRLAEVLWAGGPADSSDSAKVFALRANGFGVHDSSAVFSTALDVRPNPIAAAIPRASNLLAPPAVVAVTTLAQGADTTSAGGRVWLLDQNGDPVGGWPAHLPSIVTTPPIIVGAFQDTFVYVGCADGRVYALKLDGSIAATSAPPLAGGVAGRLAAYPEPISGLGRPDPFMLVAAGGAGGQVAAFAHALPTGGGGALQSLAGWPVSVGHSGLAPDFVWIDFGGARNASSPTLSTSPDCTNGALTLVVHDADVLRAYCLSGSPLSGWGTALGDTIVAGLAAGDVDGDGFPEVIAQTRGSAVYFFTIAGRPSPGWPKRGTLERFRTDSPPLALDLQSRGLTQAVAMNASGIVDAFDGLGREPPGWPLATGLGATGAPVAADLDGDHQLELVVPDARGLLYAYSLPTRDSALVTTSWPMVGGDAQRSSALRIQLTPTGPPPTAGPLVQGSLKAYPNPARRKPVTFAYRMTEPGDVEFRILDTSGHEVAKFVRHARQAENVEVWEPGSLPAGIYVARLRFRGATSEQSESLPVGLLR